MQPVQPVGQCRRAGLQDQRRFDLVQLTVAHRRHAGPAGACGHPLGSKLLAAPRADDQVGRGGDHLLQVGDDAVAAQRRSRPLWKDVVATGHADQFADPADRADRRLVPFLEIHPGPARQRSGCEAHRFHMGGQAVGVGRGLVGHAHQRAQPPHIAEDAVDRAVVADPHLDAGADQRGGDVGLHVGKPDRQVGLQGQDLVDLGAGEGADARFLVAGLGRPHGKSGDADDAVLLAQRVEHLGGFFGQADDALGQGGHVSDSRRLLFSGGMAPRKASFATTGDGLAGAAIPLRPG